MDMMKLIAKVESALAELKAACAGDEAPEMEEGADEMEVEEGEEKASASPDKKAMLAAMLKKKHGA